MTCLSTLHYWIGWFVARSHDFPHHKVIFKSIKNLKHLQTWPNVDRKKKRKEEQWDIKSEELLKSLAEDYNKIANLFLARLTKLIHEPCWTSWWYCSFILSTFRNEDTLTHIHKMESLTLTFLNVFVKVSGSTLANLTVISCNPVDVDFKCWKQDDEHTVVTMVICRR